MLNSILGFFGGIKNSLIAFGAAAMGVLYLLLRLEKANNKVNKARADTAEANQELLEKEKEIVTDLDLMKEKDHKKLQEKKEQQKVQLEVLKNEDDNNIVVDSTLRMLNKDSNEA